MMPDVVIHEMTAINEITAKMNHVSFTCNCLSCCENELTDACSCRKDVPKISATAMKSISRKVLFLKVVNVL